ncbi:MAG: dockerin type I repeat-containing protein [Planctomycetota bacterium]
MPRTSKILTAASVALIVAPAVHAAFTTPSWTRPADTSQATTDGTSYQQWEIFSSPGGPNTPVDDFNPAGTADFFDANPTSGAFIASSGNIYSSSGVINPTAVVPVVNANTEFLVQVRSFGQLIDTADITVNGTPITSLDGFGYAELFREDTTFLGFPAAVIDHAWTFTAPAASSYTIDWAWGVTSSSVDRVAIDTRAVPGLAGDFDSDGDNDADDIDLLLTEINGAADPAFDLTDDGLTDGDDLIELLETILETRAGDANLDGEVGTGDLAILAGGFNGPATGWAQADFNGDGTVGTGDLAILAGNFGFAATPLAAATSAIPEPTTLAVALGLAAMTAPVARRRVRR